MWVVFGPKVCHLVAQVISTDPGEQVTRQKRELVFNQGAVCQAFISLRLSVSSSPLCNEYVPAGTLHKQRMKNKREASKITRW